VWQIGKFDEASFEFHEGAPATDPVFTVGKSDPAQDWYEDQPGTSNGVAGFREHPFTIKFELPQAPKGLYTLKLSLLTYTRGLPVLAVAMNGHRGRFFQHPILNYSGGNFRGHFIPHYAKSVITFDVPTQFLQQGTNTLVLTAIDEPGKQAASRGAESGSLITYDALSLENDPAKSYSTEAISAEIVPTMFYKTTSKGLVEIVEVFVRYNETPKSGQVTLALGSGQFNRELAKGTDFGEQKFSFEVPEFSSPTTARATVSLNGRSRTLPAEVKPEKKWTMFMVPNTHHDNGYTDYPPKVAEVQSRNIDAAIQMIREHPDYRYSTDSFWVFEQFMAGRSDAERKEFLRLVKERKLFAPAAYVQASTGTANIEYLLRSFYPAHKLFKENGGEFDYTGITDIPSHTWSLPSIAASAGLKYLMLAANQDLGPILLWGRLHEKSPFWWEGPDGQRILTWYSRHYNQVGALFGMPPSLQAGYDTLPRFIQPYTRPDYKSDGTIMFGTQSDNQSVDPAQASLASDWNAVYAYPKLKFSGVSEAMGYIAGQMGDSIPVIKGDGVAYWSGGGANRENQHRILTAEKLSTISSLVDPRIWPDRRALDLAWSGILFSEAHSFGGGRDNTIAARHGGGPQTAENTRWLERLLMRGMSALSDSTRVPSGTLTVFNALSWPRSGLVEVAIAAGQEPVDPATNQVVPYEVVSVVDLTARMSSLMPSEAARLAGRRIRFLATEVPAVGYKNYILRRTDAQAPALAALEGRILENAYYRVTFNPTTGAVDSVFDKELNRELVDASGPYRFNQYVNVAGTVSFYNQRGINPEVVLPPKLETQVPKTGRLVSMSKTSYGAIARLETSGADNARITTEIVLFDGQKKIEITNRLERATSSYFVFPFAMDRPEFRYEIQNGVVNAPKDILPGGGMENFPVQHWASVSQDDVTVAVVPVDAPIVTFGDIRRYTWPKEFGTRKAAIFSSLGRAGGPGREFRYVFTSGRNVAPSLLSRMGWGAMTPFELNTVVSNDKVGNPPRPLDPVKGSFLEVDNPAAVLLVWKRAEDENGTIMRFVETDGQAGTVKVSSPVLNVDRAWLCNSMEENRQPLTVAGGGFSFNVKPFEIVTVRLDGTPRLK
jgi:hypothetical protein